MSKGFLWGVGGAVVALAVFFGGFFAGATVNNGFRSEDVQAADNALERKSPQMECIHWVEKWRGTSDTTIGVNGPNFAMFTALCGKPETSHK